MIDYEQMVIDATKRIQQDLDKANVKIKLCEAQIIFVEKTSIAKQVQADKDIQVLAEAIHYPDCWDTMAYPTLLSAITEVNHCTTCANKYKDKV